ncbi:hypothetical protein HanRHA438_Chr06g0251061 [Helianthus annuus]|nr:hypothetical protein HanRHA438_Chr06g0251061 [Helianthus annuus]
MEENDLLFFLEPPPTGTFLRDPPSVQYLLQVLQKYLGCERLLQLNLFVVLLFFPKMKNLKRVLNMNLWCFVPLFLP